MTEIKKGAMRKQLGIPAGKHVPKTLVRKITKADVGEIIKNPTSIGKTNITVTEKLKKRAYFLESFY
jgi:hypothetical protein